MRWMKVVVRMPDGRSVSEMIAEAISLAGRAREILESLTLEPEVTLEPDARDETGRS